MPAWLRAEDEDKWAKAKAAAKESYPDLSEEDDKFWAIVATIFKKMGGKPGKKSLRLVPEAKKSLCETLVVVLPSKGAPVPRLVLKGHKLHYQTDFQGISVSVENRKGSIRRGKQKDGKEWETKMFWPYGRIPYTKGKDGEAVDCFIGPNKESQKVFVVHQRTPDGEHYDEDKCLLGFDDEEHARDAFLAHYDSQKFLGEITEMGIDEFKEKLAETREHPKMLKSLPRLVLKALPYHLEGGEGSAHRGSRHSPGKGATKTRHYRIPERATKLREAHGKVGGHDVRIQLFRDYDRYFFTAWRDDWRRMVVKQISGRNLATAERWWNENAQEIGAEAINLESLAKSLPYHLEGGAGSSHKGSKRRVGKRSPRVKSDAERLGVTKSTPKPWKVLGVLYPVMSEFVSGREQYATVERVLAHARLNYLTPQEVQVQVRRYLLDLAAVHALRFKSARPLMIWIDPTKEDQPYVRGKYWPQEAALEVTNKTAESIVHEFGHYLAYEVLDPTVLHSVGERLRYLPEVDRGAAEIDERARMTGDILHGSAYWRSDQELWARAYEHWATKRLAPDSSLRAALYEYHKPDPGKLAVWWDESADWVDRTVDKVMGQYTKEVEKALALWLDKALPYHLEGGQGSSHRGAKRRLGKQTVKQSRAEKFGGPGTFSANAAKVITGESPVTAGSDWFLKQQRDYLRERLQKLDALVDEVESKGMTREPWLEYAYFKGARDYLREILGVQETPSGPEVAPTPVTPPPEAPPVAAVAKEPWEMTRQEYYNWTADGMEQQAQRAADELAKPTRAWTPSRMRDIEQPRLSAEKLRKGDATGLPDLEGHRRAQIEHAAAQGKIGEGIKDYPDLQAKHRKSPRLELSLRNPTRSVSRGIPGMPKGYSHSFADFAQGRQIGIHRGDELIMVANWNKGKPDDIEFTEPKYLKINKIRQSAIHALRAAVRHHA